MDTELLMAHITVAAWVKSCTTLQQLNNIELFLIKKGWRDDEFLDKVISAKCSFLAKINMVKNIRPLCAN